MHCIEMINHSLSMSLVNVDVTDAGGVSVFPLPQLSNLLPVLQLVIKLQNAV